MYNFVDTTEVSDAALLPSEAMKINGEYIENQITGYRTLYVSGREALAPELTTYKTAAMMEKDLLCAVIRQGCLR